MRAKLMVSAPESNEDTSTEARYFDNVIPGVRFSQIDAPRVRTRRRHRWAAGSSSSRVFSRVKYLSIRHDGQIRKA